MLLFVKIFFLFVQGLLAGFSFSTLYLRLSSGSDESFLASYQPYASEFRRFYFIIVTISFVGSLDYTMTAAANVRVVNTSDLNRRKLRYPLSYLTGKSFQNQTHAVKINHNCLRLYITTIVSIIYALCFLSMIIMSGTDVLINLKNGYDSVSSSSGSASGTSSTSNAWVQAALEDAVFMQSYTRWKDLDRLRLITALFAWIGSCLILAVEYIMYSYANVELNALYEVLSTVRTRVDELSGNPGLYPNFVYTYMYIYNE
jgi:hypothetical protein